MPKNRVNISDVCELAHALTIEECERRGITVDKKGGEEYTGKAQKIFNSFYDLITNTLNV